MNVTDEMVRAFLMHPPVAPDGWKPALAAALAAAPTADGWVWCERMGGVVHDRGSLSLRSCESPFSRESCPGPHRSLLLGPEVEA